MSQPEENKPAPMQEDVQPDGKEEDEEPYSKRVEQLADFLFKENRVFLQDMSWKVQKASRAGYGLNEGLPFAHMDKEKSDWFEEQLAYVIASMVEHDD